MSRCPAARSALASSDADDAMPHLPLQSSLQPSAWQSPEETERGFRYEGCSLTDVNRSTKQEVVIRFTHKIHIPSEYSPLLCTHSSGRLRQDSKVS